MMDGDAEFRAGMKARRRCWVAAVHGAGFVLWLAPLLSGQDHAWNEPVEHAYALRDGVELKALCLLHEKAGRAGEKTSNRSFSRRRMGDGGTAMGVSPRQAFR